MNASYILAKKSGSTTNKHEGITIDENSGDISVSDTVPAGTYELTVTATPESDRKFIGTKNADLTLIVQQSLNAYTLTYDTITTSINTAVNEVQKANTIPLAANVTYAIATKYGTTLEKHVGIIVNATTGTISVSDLVPAGIYEVTITATPKAGGMYTGTRTAEASITVTTTNIDINTLDLAYGTIISVVTAAANGMPITNDIPADTARYTITTKADTTPIKHGDITINENTGAISTTAAMSAGIYNLTVIATAKDGSAYTGTKTANATVIVTKIDINSSTYKFEYNAATTNTVTLTSTSDLPPSTTYAITSISDTVAATIDADTGTVTIGEDTKINILGTIQVTAVGNGIHTQTLGRFLFLSF